MGLVPGLGKQCRPILEKRYGYFLNTSTIDILAKVGVNTLRITTTYAAWVKVPGSAFYHEAVDKRIPVMLQDNFKGAAFWPPLCDKKRNLVIDSHIYYFAASGTYLQHVTPAVCVQASYLAQETKLPVFVGEWSLQTLYNNTLSVPNCKAIFDTQRYNWQRHVAGDAFLTAVSYSTTAADGHGTQCDYCSYVDLARAGVVTKAATKSYC